MLRVTIEILPGGNADNPMLIDTVYIGNDGTGTRDVGCYDVYVQDPTDRPYPRSTRPGWVGKLKWLSRRGPKTGRLLLAMKAVELVLRETQRGELHDR